MPTDYRSGGIIKSEKPLGSMRTLVVFFDTDGEAYRYIIEINGEKYEKV